MAPGQAFSHSNQPLDKVTQSEVLSGEQFVHHYDSHEHYLELFRDKGLKPVSDYELLAANKRGDYLNGISISKEGTAI